MPTPPIFQVGDVIYLIESAKVGALESYAIAAVRQDINLIWFYTLAVPVRPPLSTTTVGDRITLKQSRDFEVVESEVGTLCDVIDLAISNTQAILLNLQTIKSNQCDETA